MVRENLVSPKELSGLPKGSRDFYLANAFKLSPYQMGRVLDMRVGSTDERITTLGLYLRDHLREVNDKGQYPPINVGAQFTNFNLSLLTGSSEAAVSSAIRRGYGPERRRLEAATGLSRIPNMHILRDELGVYEGNLPDAKKKWPGLQASTYDWQGSVRVPLEYSVELAYVLGIALADATSTERDGFNLWFRGREDDAELYNGGLAPLLFDLFNKKLTVYEGPVGGQGEHGFDTQANVVGIHVESKAVHTLLTSHLGFPKYRKKRRLPGNLPTEYRPALLAGLMAGMASIGENKGSLRLRMIDHDKAFVRDIGNLATGLSFPTTIVDVPAPENGLRAKTQYRAVLSNGTVDRLIDKGYITNPRHHKRIEDLAGEVDGPSARIIELPHPMSRSDQSQVSATDRAA